MTETTRHTTRRHASSNDAGWLSHAGSSRRRPNFAMRPLALALAASSLLSVPPAMSPAWAQAARGIPGLPSGMTVINGQVKAVTTGKQLTITNSSGSILSWQNFSIGAGNGVTFAQPSAQSSVLNRVVGNDPSSILGSLSSNGRVWLLNPNGVIFGQGARVDVAGLVTSTLNLNDNDWLAGRYKLTGGSASAGIVNQGELRSSLGGHIALIGGSVTNEGVIEAKGGQVFLAAGKSVEMIDTGSPNMRLLVTAPEGEALNLGTLAAAGGRIDVHAAVVNQQGVVRADSLEAGPSGNIVLRASKALDLAAGSVTKAAGVGEAAGGSISLDSGAAGTTLVHGDVLASGSTGGLIQVLGRNVGLVDAARLDVSGPAGGGQVLVGGGMGGRDAAIRNSEAVFIGPTASLKADASELGNGGQLIVWSDQATRAYGSFSAKGGPAGGNGGFIETSGGWLDVKPARLDASARIGLAGTWLVDPHDIVITDSPGDSGVVPGTTFTAANDNARISTSSIIGALNRGNSVTVSTGAAGSQRGNITLVGANILVNPPANTSLSLNAASDINIGSDSTIQSLSPLALNLTGGSGGNGRIRVAGQINTAGGDIVLTSTSTSGTAIEISGSANSTSLNAGNGSITIVGSNRLAAGALGVGYSTFGVALYDATLSARSVDINATLDGSSDGNGQGSDYLGAALAAFRSNIAAENISLIGNANVATRRTSGIELSSSNLQSTKTIGLDGTGLAGGVSIAGGSLKVVPSSSEALGAALSITGTAYDSNNNLTAVYLGGNEIVLGGQTALSAFGNTPASPSGTSVLIDSPVKGSNAATVTFGGPTVVAQSSVDTGGQIRFDADNVRLQGNVALSSQALNTAILFRGYSRDNVNSFNTPSGRLATPNGRWLIFARGDVSSENFSIPGIWDFKQYGASSRQAYTLEGNGNGLLFDSVPSLTIGGANLAFDSRISKVYDGTLTSGRLASDGVLYNGTIQNDRVGLVPGATGTHAGKEVGNGLPIDVTKDKLIITDPYGKPVYGYRINSTFRGDISPAPLTVRAEDSSKVFGDTKTFNGTEFRSAGLVGGETIGTVDLQSAGATSSANANQSYPITPSNARGGTFSSTNYSITYVDGSLTVTRAPLNVVVGSVIGNPTKAYDGNTDATLTPANYSLTGFAGTDSASVTKTSGTYDSANAGGRTVTVNLAASDFVASAGTVLSNYTLPLMVTGRGTIDPKLLTLVNIRNNDKVYDGSILATGLFDVNGFVGSDALSVLASGNFDNKNAGIGKTVSLYDVAISTLAGGTGLPSNYRIAPTATTTGNITPAALTVTANNASKAYGTTLSFTGSEFSSSGLRGNETIGTVTLQAVGTAPSDAVGSFAIVPSNARGGTFAPSNYDITYATGTLTVNRGELRIVTGGVIGNPTKVYDGTTTATLTPLNYSLTGLAPGESASVHQATGTYDSPNAGNRTITVNLTGSNYVAGAGTDLNNYNLPTVVTGRGTIDAKLLTLVGLRAENRDYDGTNLASLSDSGTLSGLVGTERLRVTNTSATFDNKNVGIGKTVTVNGMNLTNLPGDNGDGAPLPSNYRLASTATTTADIAPKEVFARNVTAASKNYDGTTVASVSVGSYDGLVFNETLGTSGLIGSFDSKDVGTQRLVTVTNTGLLDGANGGLAGNYRIAPSTTARADIDPAALTITANDQTKPYNSELVFVGTEFAAKGLVKDEVVSRVTLVSAGAQQSARVEDSPYRIVPSDVLGAGEFKASNYRIEYLNGTLTVSPLQLQVVASLTGNPTKIYDGDAGATVKASDFSLRGFVNDDGADITKATGTYDSVNAGSRTVTVSLVRSDFAARGETSLRNYILPNIVTGSGTIHQKPVTLIQVSANSRDYDGTREATLNGPALFSGLVGGETLTLRGYLAQFDDKNVGVGKTVIVSRIDIGDGAGLASNYILSPTHLASTTADIAAKPLSFATVVAANKDYDARTGATVTLGNLIGLVDGEALGKSATGTFDTKDAGTGKTVTVTSSVSDGPNGLASNYRILPTTTTTANIDPRPVTIGGATAANKTYDGKTAAVVTLGEVTGLVGSEALSTSAVGNFIDKDAGVGKDVLVTASLGNGADGSLASNYRLTANTLTTRANVDQALVTASIVTAASRAYDGTVAAVVALGPLTGLVGDETLGSTAAGRFDTRNVGIAKRVDVSTALQNGANGGLAGNYRTAPTTTTADITPATLTYTSDVARKIVGAPLPALSGSVTGFVDGETQASVTTGTLGFSTSAKADSPAGAYAVDGGGLTAGNYRFVQAPGNATALSITGLPPQAAEDTTKAALSNSLTSVTLAAIASSPAEGRVADVTTSLQPASSTSTGSSFQRVSVGSMSQDELVAMLNSRDRYKKNIFDVAIRQLEQDPKLADTAECATAADAETGACVITEKVKDQIRQNRVAASAASDPVTASSAGVAAPDHGAPARVAGSSLAQIAAAAAKPGTAAARVIKAREQAAIRRKVLEASLPQIERKFAVVIGVDDYEDDAIPGLDNSVGDSRAVGQVLESQLGYETLYIENASKSRVIAALNKLAVDVGPKDSVVIYYAGHGELIESTKLGYWQLADSNSKDPSTWLSNADITRLIGRIGASQIALISDSCYSGSLVDERIRSGGNVDPSSVLGVKSVVVMSSGGNEPVFDAGKDGHSPFAFSLMNNLKSVAKWQAGGNVFERIRFQVARELPQRPQYGSNATAGHQAGGDYLFEQRRSEVGTR